MNIYGFAVVVEGLDVEDPEQIDTIYTDDFVLVASEVDGLTMLDLEIEADSGEHALQQLQDHLCSVPGLRLVRVDEDLVNTSEIASRLAVSRETPRTWMTQSPSGVPFPVPYTVVGAPGKPQKLWRWADVYAWAHTLNNGKLDDLSTPLDSATVTWINGQLLPQAVVAPSWHLIVLAKHRAPAQVPGFGEMSRKRFATGFESRNRQVWTVTESAGEWVGAGR